MQTLELLAGTDITKAARMLVASAPARANFNGITIRAKYATTKPHDIVVRYHRLMDERSTIWRHSPEGRAYAARDAAEVAEQQAACDMGLARMPALDFDDVGAVLSWVETMLRPCDRVGVRFDRPAIVAMFSVHGWEAGANCNDSFVADDARNVAGWIVGQWLKGYPNLGGYIADWRAKFGTAIVAAA